MMRAPTLVRPVRGILLALAGLLLAVGFSLATTTTASAAGDQIDKFSIEYEMGTDGVLQAKETIVWRFGSDSGRHGIDRYFVTREPYDDQQDAVYTVDVESVTSPDSGVATQYSENTYETDGGRGEQLRIRIGDPDETISSPTATYVITYSVTGAMRTFSGYDEFYWDATGSDWKAPMTDVSVKATVPGGAQELSCFAGPVQSKQECTSDKIVDGVGEFTQASLPAGQGLTIGVKVKPGLIADNAPHLEPDGSKLSAGEKAGLVALAGVGAASLVGSPIVGTLWWRKNGRDQRYAGLAPGTVPLPGQQAPVVPSDPDLPIPVAFTPPRIPVAEAGLLIDGQVDTRETAATIIDLAVKGALTVQSEGKKDFQVTLVDPNRATAPHEMVLLTELFGGQPPGAVEDLSKQGSLTAAHQAMQKSVRNQVASRGWFRKVPSAAATSGFGFGLVVFAVFLGFASVRSSCWSWCRCCRSSSRSRSSGSSCAAVSEPPTAGRSATRWRDSRPIWRPPRRIRSGSRRGRTSSPSTCPGRSRSSWPTGGRRSAATWWPWAGCPTRRPTGTSAATTWPPSTPAS